jgi:hypothetical protein
MDQNKRDVFRTFIPSGLRELAEQNAGHTISAEAMHSCENILGGISKVAETVAERPGITRNKFLQLTGYGSFSYLCLSFLQIVSSVARPRSAKAIFSKEANHF